MKNDTQKSERVAPVIVYIIRWVSVKHLKTASRTGSILDLLKQIGYGVYTFCALTHAKTRARTHVFFKVVFSINQHHPCPLAESVLLLAFSLRLVWFHLTHRASTLT